MKVNGRQIDHHRLVMEHVLGRQLLPTEIVHHINGDRDDDRPENLRLMSASEHARLHVTEKTVATISRYSFRSGGHPNAKLTEGQVREIRATPRRRWVIRDLAAKFGVSESAIHHVRTFQNWKHIVQDERR